MTFLEDLQRSEARVDQLRQMLEDESKARAGVIAAKHSVEQELGRVKAELASSVQDVLSRDVTISDLKALVDRTVLLEQDANAWRDRANRDAASFTKAAAELETVRADAKRVAAELEEAKIELAAGKDESDRAKALLEAFRQRTEADKVILSG